jgi:hypothetical protein
MGAELFNHLGFSVERQKKFTDVMLSQAKTATQYFETARAEALQRLMR